MTSTIIRSLWFSLSVLLLMVLWEVLTFELPREPISIVWKERLFSHAVLVGLVAVGALIGGAIGFYFSPSGQVLSMWRLAALGVVFALVIFFAIVPLLQLGSEMAVFVGSVVVAAVIVQTVGRFLAQNHA